MLTALLNERLDFFRFSEEDEIEAICEQELNISAMKGCFVSIFNHFSSFNKTFIWCNYLKDCFSIFAA